MKRLTPAVAAIATITCAVLMLPVVPGCAQLGPCAVQIARAGVWGSVTRDAILLLASITVLAWSGRMIHLAVKTRALLHQLPLCESPDRLRTAVERTGAARVVCVDATVDLAFCAGILRPQIFVARAAVDRLEQPELDAILLHERHHSQRRDPLRYAAFMALKDVCFYLPILAWIARYQRENAELAADRAAIAGVGRCPVARALVSLAAPSDPSPLAAFDGCVDLRVAQVLGDPLPIRRPSRSLWLTSAVGVLSLAATAGCLAQLLL